MSPAFRSKLKLFGVLALLIGGGAGAWLWMRAGATPPAQHEARPVTVSLGTLKKGDLPVVEEGLGTVTPLADITLRTQINGQLQSLNFQEGQLVHQGDFLAQIDPRPYEASLAQAQGALQKDQALLQEARKDLDRYTKLAAKDSVSKQQLDAQDSLVRQYQGSVATDQGQIDAAKLNITYCHIVAPISGRVGLRQVDAGNYAQVSDPNGLVVITQMDPISVIFTLPEDSLPSVLKRLAAGAELPVAVFDRAGAIKLSDGKLTAIDNQINTSTGTVRLRAQFDNPEGLLFPNQFVTVRITVDTLRDVVLAPQAALLRGAGGAFVYLAQEDGTVAMRPVKIGGTDQAQVQILDGLQAGDKVVIDGTDKLRDGGAYKAAETAAPIRK